MQETTFKQTTKQRELAKKCNSSKSCNFAEGCSFYKLAVLFFIGAFLGDVIETVFCFFYYGEIMSRSSVVYGPFSIVWGLGCSLLTALLYPFRNKSVSFLFWMGTLLGGIYEYLCSVFTEMVFGTIFWDYSDYTLQLGGRINLLFCFFWGIAVVVWLRFLYPKLSAVIEKIPVRTGVIATNALIVFMVFDMLVSSLAMMRYTERNTPGMNSASRIQEGTASLFSASDADTRTALEVFLDTHFPDERMEKIYPHVTIVETEVMSFRVEFSY